MTPGKEFKKYGDQTCDSLIFVSDHYKLELTGNEFYCFKIEAVQFLLYNGLTSNPRRGGGGGGHDTSVLLVEISIHGLLCYRITRHSKHIIHE